MTQRNGLPSDHFAAFAFASADILLEADNDHDIQFADGAVSALLGMSGQDLMQYKLEDIVIEAHQTRLQNMLAALHTMHRVDAVALTLKHKNGSQVEFRLSGVHVDHKGGRYYLSLRAESLMMSPKDLDEVDPESGLQDMESYAIKAGEHITKAAECGEEVEVTILDFPGLKEALDALSVEQAKQLMHSIGNYLKTRAIHKDAAGVIKRDSYSIITPAGINKSEMVKDIKDIVTKQITGLDLQVNLTTVQTRNDEYPLTEKDTANAVLYTLNKFAAHKGKDFNITNLNESYEEMLDETLNHIVEFRNLLKEDEFELAFQPIVNIRTGLVHHFECLVRLHNQETFKNPFELVTFGEQAGLINEFDFAITHKVLDVMREQRRAGNPVRLAVNLSGRSLGSNIFMDTFLNLMRDNEDLRDDLLVEITESYKIENMAMVNDFIQTLREEGNPVCLDDFGTGESSFDYLRHLHVDFIKIDGSYVRDSMKTARGRKLLKAMANLCRSLDMQTIGEMVETTQEAEFLHECGVQYGQGYLFGKPDTNVKTLQSQDKLLQHYSGMFTARTFKNEFNNQVNGEEREEWLVSL